MSRPKKKTDVPEKSVDDLSIDISQLMIGSKGQKNKQSKLTTVKNPKLGKKGQALKDISITGKTANIAIKRQRMEEDFKVINDVKLNAEFGDLEDYQHLDCIKDSKIPLQSHQIKVVNYILNNRGLLVVHSVGSGKTLSAVTAINCMKAKFANINPVIVTPLSLRVNMVKEFNKAGIDYKKIGIQLYSFTKFVRLFSQKKVKIDNSTFLILDEVHNQRNFLSERANYFLMAASLAGKVLLLTATPMINKPADIRISFGMIQGNKPTELAEYDFTDEYFKNKCSYYKITDYSYYPEVIEENIKIIMDKKYFDDYMKIEQDILATEEYRQWIKDIYGKSDINLKKFYNGIRTAVNRLEYEFSPKINWITSKIIIAKKLNPKSKFLIYSSFRRGGVDLVEKRLKLEREKYIAMSKNDAKYNDIIPSFEYARIDGSVKEDARASIVKKYNEGKIKTLLITKAGSEGLDLSETRVVIIMEPTWNQSSLNQVKGRAIRYKSHTDLPPNEQKVNVYNLFMIKPQEIDIDPSKVFKNPGLSADLLLQGIINEKNHEISIAIDMLQRNSIENNI